MSDSRYCTVGLVKSYLGIANDDDDDLIGTMIDNAQGAIDVMTGRTFVALTDTTRYLDAKANVNGRMLIFDGDLVQVTSITNGDGTAVTSGQYTLQHPNHTPYYAVRLLASAGVAWRYTDDGDSENAITVVGRWAYSITPPTPIVQACIRLASFYYRQKDAQLQDVTAIEQGVVIRPVGIPIDVKAILQPYVKVIGSG